MTGTVRVRLRVTGRVQGVGFRWFVREQAHRLGLSGWVRNEDDGSVLLETEGPANLVGALQSAVEQGPAGARVELVQPLRAGHEALPQPFAVER